MIGPLRIAPFALAFCLPAMAAPEGSAAAGLVSYATGDPDIDGLQGLFRRALEASRAELTGATGRVGAFAAGAPHPRVWVRENATVIPLSRYLYPREYLSSWIEELLAHQEAGGALPDWFAAGAPELFLADAPGVREVGRAEGTILSAYRNPVASDQESSLALAFAQVYRMTGHRAWLHLPVRGRGLFARVQDGLNAVLRHRLDARTGLVTTGFTADWGDVAPAPTDPRAGDSDEGLPRVGSLYASALFGAAAASVAELFDSLHEPGRAAYWRHHAARVRRAIDRHLWQEQRGFYRMHSTSPLGDHSDRFPMGGNAVALLAGAGDEARLARVLDVAERRRRRYGVSTIAGALLPPFRRGFFEQPALAEGWSHQNGGQWDSFAGRLLLAAFERGESRRAYAHLRELARKARRNSGLYEWHTREGEGRGSAAYAGSAGAVAAAVLDGLFGVDLAAERLEITVRLAEHSGHVRLQEPTTTTMVAYRYDADLAANRLRLEYESSHRRPGRVALLLPAGRRVAALRLDGKAVKGERFRVGRDAYVAVPTDFRPHVLEAMLQQGRVP